MPDEVAETAAALWHGHDIVDLNFDYYAAVAGNDLNAMSLNAFTMFVTERGLVSNKKGSWCKQSDIDRIFISVDAAATRVEKEVRVHAAWHAHPHPLMPHASETRDYKAWLHEQLRAPHLGA